MSRARRIAELPAGSRARWVVLGFWVVVLAVAFPLSQKLTGAERNDASAWLPAGAESTKVLEELSRFQSPDIYPGVVVYVRASGLTAADRAKAAADARVRAAVHAVPGGHALVGGYTAVSLDEARASTHDRNVTIPLILAVVFVILAVLLRALAAPLVLMATVVLSFAAALGVSAFFFTHVFGFGGADTAFPLLVFVFLVALGIDYNIFLMTRVREETARHGARRGAVTGLAATGGVITCAGFVLAGTFAALATISFTAMTELGFAIAFGILLDTIVVRSVLVTALSLDLGRWMWWPGRLARRPALAPAELSQERAGAMTAAAAGGTLSRPAGKEG